jgi:hypothetical protein
VTDSVISGWPTDDFLIRAPRRTDTDQASATTTHARARSKPSLSRRRTSRFASIIPFVFGAAVAICLWIGWSNRDDSALTPESGLGYWLGIAGTTMMLLSLLYPLRKRVPALRAIGTVAFWFRAHMMLGALGCVLILWHANFQLGSINSNVALLAMLVVAASGIVGRYLYSRIHRGLYGQRAVVRDLLADAEALRQLLGNEIPVAERVLARLNAFARLGTMGADGITMGLVLVPATSLRGTVVRMRVMAGLRKAVATEGKRIGWSRRVRRQKLAAASTLVNLHIAAVKKAAALAFYDRLFRAWHIFHMPLFFLLVIAAIIHIYAAHLF